MPDAILLRYDEPEHWPDDLARLADFIARGGMEARPTTLLEHLNHIRMRDPFAEQARDALAELRRRNAPGR